MAHCDQAVLGFPGAATPYTNEPTETKNYVSEIIEPFGPRSGKWVAQAAQGQDISEEKSFTFTLSGVYKSVTLTTGISIKSSYTLHGPEAGAMLNNGYMEAQGRYLFHVLWGTLVRTSWEVYEKKTGKLLGRFESYHIEPERNSSGTEIVRPYTPYYAEFGADLCVDAGASNIKRWATWRSIAQIDQVIREDPERMINGIGPQED